jgi:hypothetical protein
MVRKSLVTVLPSPETRRWGARRKATVVAAVCSGMITLEEACCRYQLSEEEFFAWQRAFETMALTVCMPPASGNTGILDPLDGQNRHRRRRRQCSKVLERKNRKARNNR